MSDYSNMPATARWIADFIQRIGFPIFVALIALFLLWEQMTTSSDQIVKALNKNTEAVVALRHFLTHKYDD